MSLFGSSKASSTPSGSQKGTPSSSGLFGNKKEISRKEFRENLAKSSGRIPGAGSAFYTKRERIAFEKELPWKKYGSNISKRELGVLRIKELQKEKYITKNWDEKKRIDRKIRYFKELMK